MAIERWRSPFQELSRMEDEMEKTFGRWFRGWPWRATEERGWGWAPAVDMMERDDEIVLRADLPGLEQKDIEVTVRDGMTRTLPLPSGIEEDKVKASFKSGVLEVHLPKAKEVKGKKIEIKAA